MHTLCFPLASRPLTTDPSPNVPYGSDRPFALACHRRDYRKAYWIFGVDNWYPPKRQHWDLIQYLMLVLNTIEGER